MENNFNLLSNNPGSSEMAQTQNFQAYQLQPPAPSINMGTSEMAQTQNFQPYQFQPPAPSINPGTSEMAQTQNFQPYQFQPAAPSINRGASEVAQTQDFQSYQFQPPAPSISKSIYAAFDDFEREARQRKYQITEYEDTIENLQKILDEMIASNKKLETEYEKLQSDSLAFEALYEKNLKEKSLIENDYHNLCKEMDAASEEVALKKRKIKELKEFHETKLDQIKQVDELYKTEYKKNPKIAAVLELQKKNEELESQLKDKTQEIELSKGELRDLQIQLRDGWPSFVKKCVEIAGLHSIIREKTKFRNDLKKELEKHLSNDPNISPQRLPLTRNLMHVSSTLIGEHNFSQRVSGLAVPRVRRSSTFREMDRILNRSFTRRSTDGNRSGMSSDVSFQNKQLTTPTRSGSFLVSELRSKLKGTVMVTPMPRNQSVTCSTVGFTQNQAQITNPNAIEGYENREDDSMQSSQSHYFNQQVTNGQPNLTCSIPPSNQQILPGQNKNYQMEVEEAPPKDAAAEFIPNPTIEPRSNTNSTVVPQIPQNVIPKQQLQQQFIAQSGQLGKETGMVTPVNIQSHPPQSSTTKENQPFNFFGDSGPSSFNFGTSPSSSNFDLFGGGFFDSNATQSTTGEESPNTNFFSFF